MSKDRVMTEELWHYLLDRADLAMKRLNNAKDEAERDRAAKWFGVWMARTGVRQFQPKTSASIPK